METNSFSSDEENLGKEEIMVQTVMKEIAPYGFLVSGNYEGYKRAMFKVIPLARQQAIKDVLEYEQETIKLIQYKIAESITDRLFEGKVGISYEEILDFLRTRQKELKKKFLEEETKEDLK